MKELIEKKKGRPVKGAGSARGTKKEVRQAIEMHTPFKIDGVSEHAGTLMYSVSIPRSVHNKARIYVHPDGEASFSSEVELPRQKDIRDLGALMRIVGIK